MSQDDVHKVRAFEHPGEGRKRAKSTPKGRQVDPTAAHEIEALLGDRPRQRDLLIEYMHLVQDKYHQISAAHLAALADEMKLSFAEVFETATFYAHFDIVKEGEPNVPPLTIRVCDSLTCAMLGGEKLLQELQSKAGPGIRVVRAPCVGRCDTAPAAEVGHNFVDHATVFKVLAAAKSGDTHTLVPDYIGYDAYLADGGYKLLSRLRSGALPISNLERKWRLVPRQAALALQAFQKRGLFATDVGTGATAHMNCRSARRQLCDFALEDLATGRVFVAKIDIDIGRFDHMRADQHALQEAVRIGFEVIAVLERAGLALVAVDRHQPWARLAQHRAPFAPRRKASAAKAAQARIVE